MRSLVHRLSLLPAADPFRSQKESEMLNKLYDMGILGGSDIQLLLASWMFLATRHADRIDMNAKPSDIENKLTVSSIARRRLAVVVTKLRMAETVSDVRLISLPRVILQILVCVLTCQAVRTIEQGHVRVGPSPVTDPAMLVTRHMEDFVTWVDTSARKRTIMKYNDEVSPYVYHILLFAQYSVWDEY